MVRRLQWSSSCSIATQKTYFPPPGTEPGVDTRMRAKQLSHYQEVEGSGLPHRPEPNCGTWAWCARLPRGAGCPTWAGRAPQARSALRECALTIPAIGYPAYTLTAAPTSFVVAHLGHQAPKVKARALSQYGTHGEPEPRNLHSTSVHSTPIC